MSITKPWASGKERTNGEHSKLKWIMLVCTIVGAGVIGAASLAFAAPAEPDGTTRSAQEPTAGPLEARHLCVRKSDGVLRYAKSPSRCDGKEEKSLRLSEDRPIYACASNMGEPVRRVSRLGQCSPRETGLTLPGDSVVYFCAAERTGLLRRIIDTGECGGRKGIALVVLPTNHAPVADPQSVSTDEDTPRNITLTASDQDGDPLTYTVVDSPTDGTLTGTAPNVTYTPDADFNGTDSFTFEANDGKTDSDEATVSITVNPTADPPTDIELTTASVDENEPSGTTVGTFSTTDPDSGETHSYTLVSGTGDDDNGSFEISGGTLQTNAAFDFETKDSYSVRVETDDGNGGTFQKALTITVVDANDQPTDIALSNDEVDENQPAGTDVGTLSTTDQDSADSFTYTLVLGTGDDDNGEFQINGSTLETAGPLNYEDGATRSLRVQTSDGNGGTFEESFTITVNDANDAPTNLALSNNTVDENQSPGATLGTFSADDEDGDTQTYTFASGTGDDDNGSFTITGDTLQTNATFDFEAKDSYSIRVQTSDGNGGTVEEEFTILVSDVNDQPTDISLSPSSVDESQPSGATVGTLSTTDQDTADSHAYTLVSGTGDDDNSSFQISGDTLQTNATFDFESKDSYTVRVQTDDGNGGTFQKQLEITITDANDVPTDISLSNLTVVEHQPDGTPIGTFSSTDQDSADTFTYTLVSGAGDDDNGSFQISGSELQTNADLVTGTYSIRVETDDGNGGTFEKQFTITVVPPNFDPTDISLSNDDVDENQPSGTDVGSLSTTDPDSGDTHTYSLVSGTGDDDNSSFQINGDTLQTSATFDFETKDSYTVRVQTDDGNGGTFEKQFTILVSDVNDAPTDIALSRSDIDENQPSGTPVGTFSSSDQDTGDTFTYSLVTGTGSTDNGQFQIVNGELKTNASFNYEVKNSYSIRVHTTDNGVPAASYDEVFTITINDVNDAPTTVQDNYTGAVGNTKAVLGATLSAGEPNVTLSGMSGNVPSANDSDEDAGDSVSVVPNGNIATTLGGTVNIASDGKFTYIPGVGDKNQTDSFTYQVQDTQGATSSGTVNVGIDNVLVWYVNGSVASNGDGRSNTPLKTLAGPSASAGINAAGGTGDADGANDYIFVYGPNTYTGGLPLESGQKLVGSPQGLDVTGHPGVAPASGSNPTIENGAGDGITLNSNNTIRSVNVGNASGSGISGSSFGTLDIANAGINTNGLALNLSNGTLSGSFPVLKSVVGTGDAVPVHNVYLSGVETNGTSTLGTSSDALSGAYSDAFKIDGGSGSFTYAGNISNTSTLAANIQNKTGGTVTLSGKINDATAGKGISVSNNSAGTITFSGDSKKFAGSSGTLVDLSFPNASTATVEFTNGGLDIAGTSSAAGFKATGVDGNDGTVKVQGSNNVDSTATGRALDVQQVNIGTPAAGEGGLNFKSISANGATNGIVLNNTGSAAGLTVTGAGTTGGSGGTIQNISNRGASFINANRISLKNMNFTNAGTTNGADPTVGNSSCGDLETTPGGNLGCNAGIHLVNVTDATLDRLVMNGGKQEGINGNNVTNFTLSNSSVQNFGDQTREDGLRFRNMLGTSSISNTTVGDNEEDQVRIQNGTGGTLALTVSGNSVFQNSTTPNGGHGIEFQGDGSANMGIDVQSGTQFKNLRSIGLQALGKENVQMNVTVDQSTFQNTGSAGMDIATKDSGDTTFNVTKNTLTGQGATAINIDLGGAPTGTQNATLKGTVSTNNISSPASGAPGISLDANAGQVGQGGSVMAVVNGNTISGVTNAVGIFAAAGDGSPDMDATITNNTVSATGFAGIFAESAKVGTDTSSACMDIKNNNVANVASSAEIAVSQRFSTTFRLPGYPGGSVATFLSGQNTLNGGSVLTEGTYTGGGACTQP